MSDTTDPHDAADPSANAGTAVRYPTDHVLGVLDTRKQADAVASALTRGGFIDSEVQIETGVERAEAVNASTGRRGLADLLIRFAERIGATDEEMETKNVYVNALRDDRFVVMIAAPTEERKERATQLLREYGAHAIAFFGKYSIEYIEPPHGLSEREH